jgi:GT2 family glycosyltransferase
LKKDKSMAFKLITVLVRDQDDSLENLIEYIRDKANPGHSFPVIVDPADSEYRKEFGFDGDGSFFIKKIKVSNLVEKE